MPPLIFPGWGWGSTHLSPGQPHAAAAGGGRPCGPRGAGNGRGTGAWGGEFWGRRLRRRPRAQWVALPIAQGTQQWGGGHGRLPQRSGGAFHKGSPFPGNAVLFRSPYLPCRRGWPRAFGARPCAGGRRGPVPFGALGVGERLRGACGAARRKRSPLPHTPTWPFRIPRQIVRRSSLNRRSGHF